MFGITGLSSISFDIFDLRTKKSGFNFFTFSGFSFILLLFIAIARTKELQSNPCQSSIGSLSGIVEACNITPDILIFNIAFFYSAAVIIILFREKDWPVDTIFNNVCKILIAGTTLALCMYFLFGWGGRMVEDIITYQNNYYINIIVIIPLMTAIIVSFAYRNAQKTALPLSSFRIADIIAFMRLTIIYLILVYGYFYLTYKYMLTD